MALAVHLDMAVITTTSLRPASCGCLVGRKIFLAVAVKGSSTMQAPATVSSAFTKDSRQMAMPCTRHTSTEFRRLTFSLRRLWCHPLFSLEGVVLSECLHFFFCVSVTSACANAGLLLVLNFI